MHMHHKKSFFAQFTTGVSGFSAYVSASSYLKEMEVQKHSSVSCSLSFPNSQVAKYDVKDLIADFGGYLGLLLGMSALQLFDLVQRVWLAKGRGTCCRSRNRMKRGPERKANESTLI